MSSLFVGRKRELALLQAAIRSPQSGFIPIYGRRRVGKSELIVRALQEHPGIYFLGKQAPAAMQIAELLGVAAEAAGQPAPFHADGWKQAFQAVVAGWKRPGKVVIALDEFQWMVETSPELPSVLQGLWDREWRDSGRVLLILCGSYVGFMEREVLGRSSPLFGRRTAQIHLTGLSHVEARAFHPDWSLADAARVYAICGGIPQYLRAFEPDRSVDENIRANLLEEFAPLYREPEFLLREELRDLHSYYALLTVLAGGSLPVADIAARTGIPASSLPYYLNQLTELRYLKRRHPLTGARPNPRQVRFTLEDPLLRFWFRFVFPNTSQLGQYGADRVFQERIRPDLPAWYGGCFERLAREALAGIYRREGLMAAFEIGEYWDAKVQIDVVGVRDDDWTDLGECRWGPIPSRPELVAELRARAARYPNLRGATLRLMVFSREGIDPDEARHLGVRWVGLEEMYRAD